MVHQHKNHHAPSAIVVGGGISGLLAARRLTDAGVNVTVLARMIIWGGALGAHKVAGWC